MEEFAINSISKGNFRNIGTKVLETLSGQNPKITTTELIQKLKEKCSVSELVMDAIALSSQENNNSMVHFWTGVYAMLVELYQVCPND
ncbi:MAG: hypothetical protein FJ264_09355 [Planctomycetes bacterium]|nr:hypothetical protein [Planctomycetota bacterium]